MFTAVRNILLFSAMCALPSTVLAETSADTFSDNPASPEHSWYVQFGGYNHYNDDPEYEGDRISAGLEYHKSNAWLYGLTVFTNSYGDFSQYLYVGKTFYPLQSIPGFRLKLTGGIVHGYRGDHKDISPIHWGDSWAAGVVPTIGYQHDRLGVDIALLKASAVMFLVGYQF